MKKLFACLFAFTLISGSKAQITKYVVTFRNKASNPYSFSNPSAYLSQRAINRRSNYNIAIDSSDLPVTPGYIDSIRSAGPVTILNRSKWLNGISFQITDTTAAVIAATLARINSFAFVLTLGDVAPRPSPFPREDEKFRQKEIQVSTPQAKEMNILADVFNYGQSYNQVHMHNGEFLHNIGLRGQNMVVGVLDAGFNGYLTLRSFDSARANNQILGVYDFIARDSSVNEDHTHGMQCLSTIAANIPSQFVGTAPKASFYLFRTEDAFTEYPIEEFNWVCGAERLDSAGGDVLSSSLGYNTFNASFSAYDHTYAQMDGNTTTVTRGADLAAKKGMLIVNSAGNEGGNSWNFIVAPADGDSVLAVGAVNATGIAAGFSSMGPSADGRVKPDVASKGVATTVQLSNNTIGTGNGTSFAAPNFAGLTACLWQGFKEFNNMKVIEAIRRSGSRTNNPNDSVGYGIPDVKKATLYLLKDFVTSSVVISNCKSILSWTSKDVNTMRYEIERKNPGTGTYVKVGQLYGTGNNFAVHNYQFEDPLGGVDAGTVSYRIRQVVDTSIAGFAADYIDTLAVPLSVTCAVITATPTIDPQVVASVLPNPAFDRIFLRIGSMNGIQGLTIRIVDSKGQAVEQYRVHRLSGAVTKEISLLRLSKGKYYLQVYGKERLLQTIEFLKL